MSFHEVIVKGGLGKQFFCLFHAYKLSLKYEEKVSLNLANYSFGYKNKRIFNLDLIYPPLLNEFEISRTFFSKVLYILTRIIEKFFVKSNKKFLPGDNPFCINYWRNRYIHSGYFQKINEFELDKESLSLIKKRFNPFIVNKKCNYLAIHIRRAIIS